MLKKLIAPVVLSGALLGSLAIGGAAFAATPTASTPAASATTHTGRPAARAWLKANRRAIRKAGVVASATAIGITPQALVTELKTGKSIAQVATEHNVSPQSVIDALTKAADAKVADAVTANKLTQAQADKIDAALPARIATAVNKVR